MRARCCNRRRTQRTQPRLDNDMAISSQLDVVGANSSPSPRWIAVTVDAISHGRLDAGALIRLFGALTDHGPATT